MSHSQGAPQFRRFLRLRDLVLFGVTFVGPTAPFPLFGIVSNVSKGHMALTYLIALVAMVLTGLSYGRMAAAFPAAGSAYAYARRALHPAIGFFAGWTMLLDYLLMPMMSVIYASLTFHRLIPEIPYGVWLVIFAMAITGVNLFGLKVTNRANFAMTAVMISCVAWFAAAAIRALSHGAGSGRLLSIAPFFDPAHFSLPAIMSGTSIAAFSYLGFDGISTLAEDTVNPRKDIARATLLVCLISAALFVLQAYLGQLLWPDFTSYPLETAFLDVARRAGGGALFGAVSFVLLVAGFASAIAGQATASRLLFGMGRDRMLPHIFAYIHPKYSTPTYGVLAVGALALAGGFLISFRFAAEAVNFGALAGFMCVNLSVVKYYFVDRRERGRAGILHNLVLPAVGFLVCGSLFWSLSGAAKWIGVVWTAAGVLVLAKLTKGFARRLDASLPENIAEEKAARRP